MRTVPRRAIDELITKYQLHPTVFDLFVEGEFDQDFLHQFITPLDQKTSISVLLIDDIEVSNADISNLNLPLGSNKSRVITLSKLLEKNWGRRHQTFLVS